MSIFLNNILFSVKGMIEKNEHRDFALQVCLSYPKCITKCEVQRDEVVFYSSRFYLAPLIKGMKDHSNFEYNCLIDITAVDYPQSAYRFQVSYSLLSISNFSRIRICVPTDEITPMPSISQIFKSADWLEREVWDMFGVFFSGHPDLRRILTDYGFQGYPLRKDFPLTGYLELRYDDEQKRIVSESVELTQEYRDHNFRSPWDNIVNA